MLLCAHTFAVTTNTAPTTMMDVDISTRHLTLAAAGACQSKIYTRSYSATCFSLDDAASAALIVMTIMMIRRILILQAGGVNRKRHVASAPMFPAFAIFDEF